MSSLRNCSAFILKQSVSNILSAMGTIDANAGQHLSVRSFSRTTHLAKSRNFYDDLELPRTATQSEIKSAYYELSMAYHPDKNKTELGKLKFRLITEAYEVLGNVRTRRMYDKGIGSVGSQSTAASSPGTESEIMYNETEDDAQTKFYKQHMVKSQPPTMASRPSARDFDNYAAQLTTKSFHQMQRARNARREKEDDLREHTKTVGSYAVAMSLAFAALFITAFYEMLKNRAHDDKMRRIKQLNDKNS